MLTWLEQSGKQYAFLSNTGAKPFAAVHDKLSAGRFECLPDGRPIPQGRCYTAADAQVDFMVSGHLDAGSKLLVLAPDDGWKRMLQQRDEELLETWEVVEAMDVDKAKEWSTHAKARLEWEAAA